MVRIKLLQKQTIVEFVTKTLFETISSAQHQMWVHRRSSDSLRGLALYMFKMYLYA